MPTPLGDIFIRIGLDSKGLERGLDQVQKQSAKVFAGVSAAIAGVSVIGAGFEKEITKVGALTGATGQTFEDLGKTARTVAKETEFTAAQAAEGMGFFAMAGYTAEQAMAALKPATVLATTGFIDLGRASDIVTNIMSGFGQGFDELDHSIDVLIKTATSANTTVDMMGESMSYVAPVAKSFGISFEETSAAIGLLGDAGIQASRAGTNLRILMRKLAKPTTEAAATLKTLGVNTFDAAGKMLPLSTIFGKIAQSGMTAKQTMEVFGPRAASAALILTESMRSGEKSLLSFTNELENADGTANTIFKRMSETASFQFNVLKSNVEEAALVLWDQFKPAVMALIGAGQRLAQMFSQLSPDVLEMIANVALFTAGISALGLAVSTIGTIFMIAFAPVNLVIIAIVAAIATIGAAIMVVINRWDELVQRFKKTGRAIAGLFGDSGAYVENGPGSTAGKPIQSPATTGSLMGDLMRDVKGGLSKTFDYLGLNMNNAGNEAKVMANELEKVASKSSAAASGLNAVEEKAADIGNISIEFDFDEMERLAIAAEGKRQKAIDSANQKYTQLLNNHLNDVSAYQIELDKKMQQDVEIREQHADNMVTTGDMLYSAAKSFIGKMGKVGGLIQAGIQGAATAGPIGAIIAIVVELISSFKSIMDSIDVANEGFEMIAEALSPIFDALAPMNEAINKSLGKMLDALDPLVDFLGVFMDGFADGFESFIKSINSVISIIVKTLAPVLKALSFIFEGLNKVISVATDFMDNLFDGINNVLDEIGRGFDNLFKNTKKLTQAQADEINAQFEAMNAWLDQIDMLNQVTSALAEFASGVDNLVSQLIKEEAWASASPDFIQDQLNKFSGFSPEGIQRGVQLVLDNLMDAGLSYSEAFAKVMEGAAYANQDIIDTVSLMALAGIMPKVTAPISEAADDAAKPISNLGDAAEKATSEITNLPSGFKIATAKLAAIDTSPTVAVSSAGNLVDPYDTMTQSKQISINEVHITTNDPKTFYEQLEREAEYQNLVKTGTTAGANRGTL